ncbi:MAG: type II toxin-antitoxin system ParD family antitoxin [Ferruginibacter sp.]
MIRKTVVISREVSSDKYGSASEVIRTALRILETEEEKKTALIKTLMKGEKSKRVENFDAKAHLAKLHKNIYEETKNGFPRSCYHRK